MKGDSVAEGYCQSPEATAETFDGRLPGEDGSYLRTEHEVHPYAILLVAPGSVPVTSSGKLARRRTRDLFLKGEPSGIAPWYSVESANARRGDGTSSKIRSV